MTVTSGTKLNLLGLLGVEVPEPTVIGVRLPVGVRVSIVDAVAALEPVPSSAISRLFFSGPGLCEWWEGKLS